MDNELKATFGSWVQAIGTTLSAIGATPFKNISDTLPEDLNLWGNVLQATGNSLVADSEENFTLEKIGNAIQAIGNSTVIVGILINFNEKTKKELNIKGNLLQAVGGGVSLADALGREPTEKELYSIYGNLLQTIGNTLQALSGINELRNRKGQELNLVGSWIQAIGSIISALGQSK
jgi:hypothetical protein